MEKLRPRATVGASWSRTNPYRTPFLGRARERSFLLRELQAGARLLTIAGPSGMGKTRLAREVAQSLVGAESGIGEILFYAIPGIEQPPASPGIVAQLRKLETDLGFPLEELEEGRRRVLVILDGINGLTAALAPIVERLLAAWPQLQILTTSLMPLGLDREVRFELGSLSLKDAVLLYRDRAHRLQANRSVRGEDATIEELMLRLDRIPLAIELAAARSSVLPPGALLRLLDRRFELLQSDRAGPHGSLEKAVAMTWGSLEDSEREVLARASVFVGGFTLEAAAAVLGDQGADVLDRIDSLRGKALLQIEEEEEPRFHLYESVREFAARRLAEGATEAETIRLHAEFFLREGERRAASRSPPALRWMIREQENLLAAHRRTLDASPMESARVGVALASILGALGPHPSEFEILDSVLDAARRASSPALLLEVFRLRGSAQTRHGMASVTSTEFQEARELAGSLGAWSVLGDLLVSRGTLLVRRGEMAGAAALLEEGLAIARTAQDITLKGEIHLAFGLMEETRSNFEGATQQAEQALAAARRVGFPGLEAQTHLALGAIHSHSLQVRRARDSTERARAIFREIGSLAGEGYVLINLGAIHLTDGDLEAAEDYTTRAFHVEGGEGRPRFEAQGHLTLGVIALERGLHRLAETRLLEAISRYESSGDLRHRARALVFLAAAEALLGKVEEGRRSLEEAVFFFRRIGDDPSQVASELFEGVVEVALARRLQREESPPEAEIQELLDGARRRLLDASEPDVPPTTALAIGRRLLSDLLKAPLSRGEGLPTSIRVGPGTQWFELPGGAKVDLRRRHALRGVLAGLVQQRISSPGEGLSNAQLFELGWQGEEILPLSAAKRVYTAIWSLRSLGLSSALVYQGEGYMIDPSINVNQER